MFDDVSGDVEDWEPEQAGIVEHQDVEDSPGPTVAVCERVDGLELIVRHGHLHDWIESIVGMNEPFPVRELLSDGVGPLRRRVDDRRWSWFDAVQHLLVAVVFVDLDIRWVRVVKARSFMFSNPDLSAER